MSDSFSILVVAPRFPSAVGKADSRTVYHMVDFMQDRGHRVHLCTFYEGDLDGDLEADLQEKCATLTAVELDPLRSKLKMARGLLSSMPFQIWYYRDREMEEAIERVIREERPDIHYAHLLRTAPYLLSHEGAPDVVGMQISYTLNYRRLIRHLDGPLERFFYSVEYRRIKDYEPRMARRFDRTLLISPADAEAIETDEDLENVFFNPHGIEVDYYGEELGLSREDDTVVLNADFEAPTNVDAAVHFYENILPHVRRSVPDVRLWLVGRKPPKRLRQLATADPDVRVTGFVEDLRPYLQKATVAIDPLRVGAGLQNKILVSMASGLPVVATSVANEGIRAPEGDAILVADDPGDFADHVIHLLQDADKRDEVARRGEAWVRERWTWSYHFERLEEMLSQLKREGPDAKIEQYYPF